MTTLSILPKRFFDIVFSLFILLAVLSWLVPLVYLFNVFTLAGPVFFTQRRVGRNGRVFNIIKFRTMCPNEQADQLPAQVFDARITPPGKWLRSTGLDELPQFFNVLLGDMSVVGPRPHMLSDDKKFSSHIRDYHLRHEVKPGITGLAQANGYRGIVNGFDDIYFRHKWDMYYIRNLSFWLDLKIIFLTAAGMFSSFFVIRPNYRGQGSCTE
ncbi:sugar transferase [Flavihumibacter stibioxidans]|uniref:Bacterial sugar transferase domain-containing protein n=1 Tax=Flavihumibacter stibioxidans TaxID=1834163 RepID=A0ABR7M6Z4_9BACT|nr:sugar transferase [Flavihumibacter stibioxidans]MBC6490783.1 hypothetical protein [Flavihumibacter stibioxidans]